MKLAGKFSAAALALVLSGSLAWAQPAPATRRSAADTTAAKSNAEAASAMPNANTLPERTFYLKNAGQQRDANEIVTALRNALPGYDKIYLAYNQNAIVARASADDLALMQKLINELDRPIKNYRLTYTVTEMDGSKQIGTQHYAMIMTSGQETSLKLGNRVPIATGSFGAGGHAVGVQTQFTYVDIGMNFDATLTEMGENAMLKSSVTDSSVAPEKSTIAGVREPIVRQATLKGESILAPGKPVVLGSVDIPGSASHLNIEVVMQPLP